MVSFPEAIKMAFAGWSNWAGRSSRAEYWWWALFVGILYLIPYLGLFTAMPSSGQSVGGAFWFWSILWFIVWLALLLPTLAVLVRRLHDTDRSGWWYWISLVPCIGGIWLLILLITPSTPGQNRFG